MFLSGSDKKAEEKERQQEVANKKQHRSKNMRSNRKQGRRSKKMRWLVSRTS